MYECEWLAFFKLILPQVDAEHNPLSFITWFKQQNNKTTKKQHRPREKRINL